MSARMSSKWCRRSYCNVTCDIAYWGEACEYNIFDDDPGYVYLVGVYQVSMMIALLLLMVWNIVGIVVKIQVMPLFKISLVVSYINVLGCVVKCIHTLDPVEIYGVIPTNIIFLSIYLSEGINAAAGILMTGIWFDIAINMNYLKKVKFAKAIYVSIGISIFIIVIELVCALVNIYTSSSIAAMPSNIAIIAVILYVLFMVIFFIPKISKSFLNQNKRIKNVL